MSVIRRNILALLVSQASTWIVSVLLLVLVPGKLGAIDFGEMGFAQAYVSFFQLVAVFGAGDYLIKTIARAPESTGRYVWNTFVMKVPMTIVLAGAAVGLGVVLGFDRQRMLLTLVFSLGMVLDSTNNAVMGGLNALQRMGRPALWEAVRMYVAGCAGLVVLYLGAGVVVYSLVFNLSLIIPLVANLWGLSSELRDSRRLDVRLWREVLVGGFTFFVLSSLVLVYGRIDIPMIAAFSGSETVGWYALAYRWVSMPAFVAAVVAQAFFPALSAEIKRDRKRFIDMANRSIHLVIFMSVPAAVGIALIADDFIHLLYGAEYAESIPIMRLLALHIPIVGMDMLLGTVAISADRQRQWMYYGIAAAVFNPLTNVFAIRWTEDWYGNGAIGAAFTTVLTELILMVGALQLRPKGVFDRALASLSLRIIVASLAMVPAVVIVGSAHVLVQAVVGVVTYCAASAALRTVSLSDLRSIRGGGVAVAPEAVVESTP